MASEPNESQEQPILVLIQQIRDGQVDPRNLDKETRLQCVELFRGEGQTVSQIAQLLRTSDRTIKRHVKEIKERNALSPDQEFAAQFIGELVTRANSSYSFLLRLARNKEGTVAEKAQAELAAWHILSQLGKFLQSAGYLPIQPQSIEGNILHNFDANAVEQIKAGLTKEIVEIEKIAQETAEMPAPVREMLQGTKKALENVKPRQEGNNVQDPQ